MFYVKAFFYLARAQFVCKQIQSKHHADAVQMQKIHNLCKQEKEVGLSISLDQAKERASTEARVSLSGQTKKKEPERSRTKEGPTARL